MARTRSRVRKTDPSFSYRGGVRLSGTIVTCDASGPSTDLVFVSHARAVSAPGQGRLALRPRGRQDVLVTEQTLALLGRAGERLRRHALPAVFGRPFSLGGLRLELFPSGHLPGAASLLCEVGQRRILHAGTVCNQVPGFGAPPGEIRKADAVCLDATFGSARFVFPPRDEALEQVRGFVEQSVAGCRTPVLLVSPLGASMEVASSLVAEGFSVRGHRAFIDAVAAFRAAGAAPPAIARFAGRIGAREVLLWPPEARDAAPLRALATPAFAFVSGFSLDPRALAAVRAEVGIALSNQAGFPQLIDYVDGTHAGEVALHRGHAEDLAATLRKRGLDAYALGPPTQMPLF